MRSTIFFLLLFSFFGIQAQNYAGAENSGMGTASAGFDNFWSNRNNQAGMAFYNKASIGLHYQNNFGMTELSTKLIAATLPTKAGVFGINYSHTGYEVFNQQMVGLGYAKQLGKRIAVGVQMNYLHTHKDGIYADGGEILFEVGMMAKPMENLTVGAHLYNPAPIIMDSTDKSKQAMIFKLGAKYDFNKDVKLAFDIFKSSDFKPQIMTGIEYNYKQILAMRIGYTTLSSLTDFAATSHYGAFFFGVGFGYQNLHFDIASSRSQSLGWSPHISMIYTFSKKKKD